MKEESGNHVFNFTELNGVKKTRYDVALQILCSILQSGDKSVIISETIDLAFQYADEFLKQMNEDSPITMSDLIKQVEEKSKDMFSEDQTQIKNTITILPYDICRCPGWEKKQCETCRRREPGHPHSQEYMFAPKFDNECPHYIPKVEES